MARRGLQTPTKQAWGIISVIVFSFYFSSSCLSGRPVSTGSRVLNASAETCGSYTLVETKVDLSEWEYVSRILNRWDSYSKQFFSHFSGHQLFDVLLHFTFHGSFCSSLDSLETTSPIGLFVFTTLSPPFKSCRPSIAVSVKMPRSMVGPCVLMSFHVTLNPVPICL